MGSRLELHATLVALVDDEIPVYFQEPPNVGMSYPCIIYDKDLTDTTHADNLPYRVVNSYTVTLIEPDVDSEIPGKLNSLPTCRHTQAFKADNLYHDVYTLFF